MNQQLRRFADRACEYADYDPGYIPDEFLEKFAELIVRECIDRAERYGLGCDAVEQLKEDFGVDQ